MKIIYTNEHGGLSVVHPAKGWTAEQVLAKDVPEGTDAQIVADNKISSDRTFRNAWRKGNGRIDINLPAAKEIAHDYRRAKRDADMAPLDKIIALQIPGADAIAAESARQAIRVASATLQNDINEAATPEDLKMTLTAAGAV